MIGHLLFNRRKYWEEKEPFKITITLLEHSDPKPEFFFYSFLNFSIISYGNSPEWISIAMTATPMFFHSTDSNEPVQPPQDCLQSIYLLNLTSHFQVPGLPINAKPKQQKICYRKKPTGDCMLSLKKPNIHAFKPI